MAAHKDSFAKHEKVKALLRDPMLNFARIAERCELTRERVRQIALESGRGETGRVRQSNAKKSKEDLRRSVSLERKVAIIDRWERLGVVGGIAESRIVNEYEATRGRRRCGRCNQSKLLADFPGKANPNRCRQCNAELSNARYRDKKP